MYTSNKQPRLQVAPNCKVYPQSTVVAKQSRFQVAPTCKGVPPINSHGHFMVSVLGDCTHDLIGRQVRIDTWSIVSTCWRYSISHLFPQSVDTSLSPASLASDNRWVPCRYCTMWSNQSCHFYNRNYILKSYNYFLQWL